MDTTTTLTILALVFGFYMAWNIGANDVANAMGTSVGSKALTIKQAVIIAAVLEFAGAFLVGTHVSKTIRKGIINPEFISEKMFSVDLKFQSSLKGSEMDQPLLQQFTQHGHALSEEAIIEKRVEAGLWVIRDKGRIYTVQPTEESLEVHRSSPMMLVYGMLAALLAAALWLQFASYNGLPVSTTHCIVGAILGFGAVVGGIHAVNWGQVGFITASWVVSPLLSATISFLIFKMIQKRIFYSSHPVAAAKKITPYLVFCVFLILTLVMVFKGLKNLNLDLSFMDALLMATGVGVVAAIISHFLVSRVKEEIDEEEKEVKNTQDPQVAIALDKAVKHLSKVQNISSGDMQYRVSRLLDEVKNLNDLSQKKPRKVKDSEYKTVERIFVYLQILSAAFVAFAHGANDVANAIGPLSAVLTLLDPKNLNSGVVALESAVPIWVLALGGVGIVIGLATWGWRVIETIGKKITELTPTRGFAAEFGAATTIVLASKLGLPISTTHTLVGAVLGVGLARGIGALNLSTLRDIAISWIVTIPAGAILAIISFYTLQMIFS